MDDLVILAVRLTGPTKSETLDTLNEALRELELAGCVDDWTFRTT